MGRTLRQWNGIAHAVLDGDKADHHINISAYSIADARRVCVEAGLRDPGYREIKEYWSECWGNSMSEISPERGVWIEDKHGNVSKLFPKHKQANKK